MLPHHPRFFRPRARGRAVRGRDESATDWVALTVRDRRVESHPLRQLLLADFVGAVEPGAADDMSGRGVERVGQGELVGQLRRLA